jgi:hypothetical protein
MFILIRNKIKLNLHSDMVIILAMMLKVKNLDNIFLDLIYKLNLVLYLMDLLMNQFTKIKIFT